MQRAAVPRRRERPSPMWGNGLRGARQTPDGSAATRTRPFVMTAHSAPLPSATPVVPAPLLELPARAVAAVGAATVAALTRIGASSRFVVDVARSTAEGRTWLPMVTAQCRRIGVDCAASENPAESNSNHPMKGRCHGETFHFATYPCQSHSSAAGRVWRVTLPSVWPAFLAKT